MLLIRFLESVFWFTLCYFFARLHILCGGGRRIILWWLILALMAMSAAQLVKSILRLHGNMILVTQKYLTTYNFCNTVIDIANVLAIVQEFRSGAAEEA